MKKRLLICLISIMSISGCALEDAVDRGLDCPPRLFAYDIDPLGNPIAEPYLCMIDEIRDNSVSNCVPCDFAMHKITDDNYVYLAKNNNGDYIYSNKDYTENNDDRMYLSQNTRHYVINNYSDYKKYASTNEKVSLYAITGLCTRSDLDKYDNCQLKCSNGEECTDNECKSIIERVGQCSKFKDYNKFYENNFCPAEYPICYFGNYDDTGNNYYCSADVECTSETAHVDCKRKIPHWEFGECKNNICVVESCEDGFQAAKDGKSCVSECKVGQHYDNDAQKCIDDDVDNCGATGKKCSEIIPKWVDGICDNGICKVEECREGYQPTLDKLSCSPSSNCETGEHFDNTAQECVKDDLYNCGATGYVCSEKVPQWVDGTCVSGVCTLLECESGYKVDNNTCKSDCKVGEHYNSEHAKCVADDIDNCGATGFVCKDEIKNSSKVTCTEGKCSVTECNSGYTVNNNMCVSSCTNSEYYDSAIGKCNHSDLNNCGMKGYACSEKIDLWKDGSCENNVCTLSECQTGYKVVNNVCKPDCGSEQHYNTNTSQCEDNDINNCGSVGYKCSERVAQWSKGSCVSGVCTLYECETGYKVVNNTCKSDCKVGEHYDSDQAKCVADDINNCGATGRSCKDEIKNSKAVTCSQGKCYVSACNSGYTINNNVCVSSCTSNQYYDSSTGYCKSSDANNCGQKGYRCSEHISNWKSGSCTNNNCVVKMCNDGYAVVNNECKADCGTTKYYDSSTGSCMSSDLNNCGMKGFKCSNQVTGWYDGTCSNNVCIVSKCTTGYKPSPDGKSCVSDCKAGQHYDSSLARCVNDDIYNCGATGHKCTEEIRNSKTVSCNSGRCVVSACNSGYTINNNVCVSSCTNSQYYDSSIGACQNSETSNCGQKGYRCSEHVSNWKTGTCTNNTCVISTCNDGYAVINNECRADCGTTKYYDSSTGACVNSDVNNCGQKGYKCSYMVSNWSAGTCSSNVCSVTSCTTGYKPSSDGKSCVSDCKAGQHYDSSQARCVNDDIYNCGATGHKCTEEIRNSKTVSCNSGRCVVSACNSGYTINNNVCVSSCTNSQYYDSSIGACQNSETSNCGQKGYKCSEHVSNWKTGSCTNNTCVLSTCNDGYTVINNECRADCGTTKYYDSSTGSCVTSDVNNCGMKGYKCSANVVGWFSGDCTNNRCVPSICDTDYYKSGDLCLASTNTCCGSGCSNCLNQGKVCINGTCQKSCESGTYSCSGIPGCLTAFALSSAYHMNTDCTCKSGYYDANDNMEDGCESYD